ncbi:hypothetical protein CDD80_5493 [Ophiocordyceps camponoti-rufipedis]|uniref:Uncharacterized protein n=1 Tax=Ophiocordyceps camponoti-rufipedis TaxID=2004952 RepID=A0A2C5YVS2_9HYPO|nr:hypothetical protein CDD80_5493 [Ophiocordyceps camponoti-rufipedis]
MSPSQPFLYSARQCSDWRSPGAVFDPKAITRAGLEPTPRRAKPRGPLINLNQHPDSYELPRRARSCQSLSPRIKNWIRRLRKIQLALRLLQLTASAGIIVLMAGASVLHCLYGVHHLARSSALRPPASSAAYQAFAGFTDLFISCACTYGAFYTHHNGGSWSTLLNNLDLVHVFVQAATYIFIVLGCLSLVTLFISLWLGLVFRRISLMPPDMNPLEEHLTARPRGEVNKRSSTTTSTAEDDWGLLSGTTEKQMGKPTLRTPCIPFAFTRAQARDSRMTGNALPVQSSAYGYPSNGSRLTMHTLARGQHSGMYTKLAAEELGWPSQSSDNSMQKSFGDRLPTESLAGWKDTRAGQFGPLTAPRCRIDGSSEAGRRQAEDTRSELSERPLNLQLSGTTKRAGHPPTSDRMRLYDSDTMGAKMTNYDCLSDTSSRGTVMSKRGKGDISKSSEEMPHMAPPIILSNKRNVSSGNSYQSERIPVHERQSGGRTKQKR